MFICIYIYIVIYIYTYSYIYIWTDIFPIYSPVTHSSAVDFPAQVSSTSRMISGQRAVEAVDDTEKWWSHSKNMGCISYKHLGGYYKPYIMDIYRYKPLSKEV